MDLIPIWVRAARYLAVNGSELPSRRFLKGAPILICEATSALDKNRRALLAFIGPPDRRYCHHTPVCH